MEGTTREQEQYWVDRWNTGKTGWHRSDPHPSLVANIPTIVGNNASHKNVFVPLCGKTVDLKWLRDAGYQAIGCELSLLAVEEFFKELGEKLQRTESPDGVEIFQVPGIKIYRGDIFRIKTLENIAAVFDRAALVALPEQIRGNYVEHVKKITYNAPQILVTWEHNRPTAPPHSIPFDLVQLYYSGTYKVHLISRRVDGENISEVTYSLIPK